MVLLETQPASQQQVDLLIKSVNEYTDSVSSLLLFLILIVVAFIVWKVLKHFLSKKNSANQEKQHVSLLNKFFCKLKKLVMKEKKIQFDPNDDAEQEKTPEKHAEEEKEVKVMGLPSVCAVSSATNKSINQDGFASRYVEKAHARIIAVADGVGSSHKPEVASRFVAEKAVELVTAAVESDEYNIPFDSIFETIQNNLDEEIERNYADELEGLDYGAFATTLIVGIDFPNRFVAAYVGNGSILHVSGLFGEFPAYIPMPWNAINLLNPHSTEVKGKEALYRIFFYKGQPKQHKPSVIQVNKEMEMPGELFIVTTDGVCSADQQVVGKDDAGDLWTPCDKQLEMLYAELKRYFYGREDVNDESLKKVLDTYLLSIKESKVMRDDTTLGVFVSAEARDYFLAERNKQK